MNDNNGVRRKEVVLGCVLDMSRTMEAAPEAGILYHHRNRTLKGGEDGHGGGRSTLQDTTAFAVVAMNNNEGRSTYTSLYISLFIIEVFPI